jgi:hypothetical protein
MPAPEHRRYLSPDAERIVRELLERDMEATIEDPYAVDAAQMLTDWGVLAAEIDFDLEAAAVGLGMAKRYAKFVEKAVTDG